jgi:hypothetical protein
MVKMLNLKQYFSPISKYKIDNEYFQQNNVFEKTKYSGREWG